MNTNMGNLIILEGGEGTGKTSQALRLKRYLDSIKLDAVVLSELRDNQATASISSALLSGDPPVSSLASAFLIAAARAETYLVVGSLLIGGTSVIMDRGPLSTLVYQSDCGEVDEDIVVALNSWSMRGQKADLVLVLDCDVATANERRTARQGSSDVFEELDSTFHQHVRDAFLRRARENSLPVVDASQEFESVASAIAEHMRSVGSAG